jgi:ABC-type nickel/cobalt efflux system permease component RcnA|tara:strand:+ start:1093 stop:1794 length:702 start_codon:yes stop_codon:yes gene_type:complete
MIEPVYFAVAFIGILHGLEPGHGWPIAMLYAGTRPHPLTRAFISSLIISIAHLASSIAVVATFMIMSTFLQFSIPYVNIIAGITLTILAIRFFFEKPKGEFNENSEYLHADFVGVNHIHEHSHHEIGIHAHKHKKAKDAFISLKGIAVFALILGVAHEETFALLALAVGGIDPLTLMLTYATAIMVSLISVTLITVKVYSKMEEKLKKYEGLIPKLSGVILLATAILFFLNLR